jgi:hypothetical protein
MSLTDDDYIAAAGRGRLDKVYRYGDVIVACGGTRGAGALGVGTAARTREDFPCAPHFVPDDWRMSDAFRSPLGDGRNSWIERLRADGVTVDDDGLVHEDCRGHWTDLVDPAHLASRLRRLPD